MFGGTANIIKFNSAQDKALGEIKKDFDKTRRIPNEKELKDYDDRNFEVVKKLLESHGINTEAFIKVTDNQLKQVENFQKKHTELKNDGMLVAQTPINVIPQAHSSAANCSIYIFPYSAYNWSIRKDYRNGYGGENITYGEYNTVRPEVGFTSQKLSMVNLPQTNNDYGYQDFFAGVGVWYQVPKAGIVEVMVDAQVTSNYHRTSASSGSRFTNWSIQQYNYLSLIEPRGTPHHNAMSIMTGAGGGGVNWNSTYLPRGTTYTVKLVTDTPYQKDEWIYLQIGSRCSLTAYAKRRNVDVEMAFNWFFPKITICVP